MIEDAGRRPALWRLLAGVLTVFAVLALWMVALTGLSWLMADEAVARPDVTHGNPADTIFYLIAVAGLGLGTIVAAAAWQKRSPRSLAGPGARTLRHAAVSACVAFTGLGAVFALGLVASGIPEDSRPLAQWLAWLPLGILAIALQTGGEELFFRGYLQSQLAARFRWRFLSMGLPALLFGLAHYLPTLPLTTSLIYVAVATLFGLLAADLTVRSGSIGAAWGFHFANNALIALFIAPQGSLSGLALWTTSAEIGDVSLTAAMAGIQLAVLVVLWFAIRRTLRV